MTIYKRLLEGESIGDLLVDEIYNYLPSPELSDEEADKWMEENVEKDINKKLKEIATLIANKGEEARQAKSNQIK